MKKIIFGVIFLLLFCSVASAFSFSTLIGYVAQNNAPTVNLVKPINNGVTNQLIFTWIYKDVENDPQTQYVLQIDDNWRFESPLNFYGLDKNKVELDISLPEGTYYWRVQVRDLYGWGKLSDWRKFDLDLSAKSCSDGTLYWQCSASVPKYCDGGVLIDDCKRCGCGLNQVCQANGLCLSNNCVDGTSYGECSKSTPKYCQNGKLIDVCSICGCPDSMECYPNGMCGSKILIQPAIEEKSKTVLEYVVIFFKRLFGAL